MSDDDVEEYDIEKIKRLFFAPQCGGSIEAKEAVVSLAEGYRVVFRYLNQRLSLQSQREIEDEADPDDCITPEQLKNQLQMLLLLGHNDIASQEKFRVEAQKMGMESPYSVDFDHDDSEDRESLETEESDFRTHLAGILANHYTTNVMLERALQRGGR